MLSGKQGCKSRPGTSFGVGKGQVVVGRRTALSLVQALLPSNQEMMSEDDQCHVMVPASPETQLIVVHAQFSLALGKTGLDRPTHPAHTHKRGKRRLQGSIAHVKLPFRLLCRPTDFAPDHHPDLRARQTIER